MRAKKVLLVALGLVTELKMICLATPELVLEAPVEVARNIPAALVLLLQLPLKVVEVRLEPVIEKPAGVVQAPEAVVHISAEMDCIVLVVPVVKLSS